MGDAFDKKALHDELVRKVAGELATLERAHKAAQEAATHEEAKPENDKDTRALEQSYLARGQAKRVEEARAGLAALLAMQVRAWVDGRPAALGALVELEEGETTAYLLLAPYGGGEKLAAGRVQVVTPEAPLGRALVGKRAGDSCEVRAGGRVREIVVIGVC